MKKGFNGVSFPFRIGVKGGVVMSSTDVNSVPHIEEAIEQILNTRTKERCMEFDFKSELDTHIFEPNDISSHTLIEYQIRESLRELEDRIEVLEVQVFDQDNYIYADIFYKVLTYDTSFTKRFKVGEL